ncbi:hypothetical protein Vafri_730 [Volvox africanus]|nr:hypothetical protein Vafri_730 [Volvox africanus]
MPFIRGIVFSSDLLDGCQTLRDQLQLLQWGGLHLAVLTAQAGDADPVAAQPSGTTGCVGHYECEGLSILQLPRAGDLGASDDVGTAAEASAASWASKRGLQWPAEVLVLGAPEDAGGALHRRQQQQQPECLWGEGAAGEVLPGFVLESLEHAKAAPWQRLRLALAHANLKRAKVEARGQELMGEAAAASATGSSLPSSMPSAPASPVVVVGTAMKASRERDLAREGLLNLVPQDGVVFAPLDLSLPLDQQLPFHAILHKASDELEYGEDGTPRFGPRVRSLGDFTLRHPEISLVDPLEAAAKVINRTELAKVCSSLASLDLSPGAFDLLPASAKGGDDVGNDAYNLEGGEGSRGSPVKRQRLEGALPAEAAAAQVRVQVRAPQSTTVAGFSREEVEDARERLGCPPPYIVKPVVACGTSDSHCMALVMLPEALEGLRIPLPAVVQEFVNHDAVIFKVYVAGDKWLRRLRHLPLPQLHSSTRPCWNA